MGAGGLGALNSASGIGALVGAVVVAVGRPPPRAHDLRHHRGKFGGMLVLFGLSTSYFVSLTAALALGLLSSYTVSAPTPSSRPAATRMRGGCSASTASP